METIGSTRLIAVTNVKIANVLTTITKSVTKYLKDTEWNALSPEAQSKIIEARKKGKDEDDEDEKSVASNKSSKTIKSLSKTDKH